MSGQFRGALYKEGSVIRQRNNPETAIQLLVVEQFGFSNYKDPQIPETENVIFKFIDRIADNGGNGVRVFGFYPFGKEAQNRIEPFVRIDAKNFDINRFNDEFFDYVQRWVEYAANKGVVVLYNLYDWVGIKLPEIFCYHPFSSVTGGNADQIFNLNNSGVVAAHQRYLDKIVSTLSRYENVIFEIMNEVPPYPGWELAISWHKWASERIKRTVPNHLVAGSCIYGFVQNNSFSIAADPNVDIWFIHTGSYDLSGCQSNIGYDVGLVRPHVGQDQVIGYSTDGFGIDGLKNCHQPHIMQALAQDIRNNHLPIFSLLDGASYKYYDTQGRERPESEWRQSDVYSKGAIELLRPDIYRAIADVFAPTSLASTASSEELPSGFVGVFQVRRNSYHTLQNVRVIDGMKAFEGADQPGFLCFGDYVQGYPAKPLQVWFTLYIDRNTGDDAYIAILDVHDSNKASDQLLAKCLISRKDFQQADGLSLFSLSFTPSENAELEFRLYCFGAAVRIDKIAVVDPEALETPLTDPAQIPDMHAPNGTVDSSGGGAATTYYIQDSLRGLQPQGEIFNGVITSNGLQFQDGQWYLKYEIPTTGKGYIEFSAKGFISEELHRELSGSLFQTEYKSVIISMWNDIPPYSGNLHLIEVMRFGYIENRADATNAICFSTQAGGSFQEDSGFTRLEWDQNRTYRMRLEWGDNEAVFYRDDERIRSKGYEGTFAPVPHKVYIGVPPARFHPYAPYNLLISDVEIGPR